MICVVEQLGTVGYAEALEWQRDRLARRRRGEIPDTLLLLEHPHVYTLGRNARREHLLLSELRLREMGAEIFECNRGGDVTYHGPGQLVGYPILDLTQHRRDISWYMRSLEEVLIRAAAHCGVTAGRRPGMTGVWVGQEKLASLGVHLSRWVTTHGFAFNISTDLTYFDAIVPCGLAGVRMTSLEKILNRPVSLAEVSLQVTQHFYEVFGFEVPTPEMVARAPQEAGNPVSSAAGTIRP